MDMLFLVGALSIIIWYIIDRFKELWKELPYGKYITIGVAAVLSFLVVFCFGIDILVALGLFTEISIMGEILTALIFMSGSSAVSELVQLIKNTSDVMKIKSDNTEINYTINTNTEEENNKIVETITTSTSTSVVNTENDETNVVIEENNTVG